MLPKQVTPTARSQPITPQDIWEHLSWAPVWGPFLLMAAVIGGHHTVTEVPTILGPGLTVGLITVATVIITQRLTMTLPPGRTDGSRLLMVPTDRRRAALVTILTLAPMPEVGRCRRLTEVEVQHRPITRTQEPMLRPDRARARTLSGVAPMCRAVTRAQQWAITLLRTGQQPAFLHHKVVKLPGQAPHTEIPPLVKPQVATCTPGMTGMCTRTRAMAGRS